MTQRQLIAPKSRGLGRTLLHHLGNAVALTGGVLLSVVLQAIFSSK